MSPLRALLLAATLVAAPALGADLATPEAARDHANGILLDIGQNRLADAWVKMKAHTTIPPGRIDAFAESYRQAVQQTLKYYGPSVGMELLRAELAGESLLHLTYLVKYEVTGVLWNLTFYKARDRWMLTDFNYDINLTSLFQR
ncbi:MAG: hypothetical protein KatS3mg124_2194 [Porticoccaceae bacterium]|nr:MAG: hypothetical protein KatS3mg124_2194 [Porticoccaceae bacterium]